MRRSPMDCNPNPEKNKNIILGTAGHIDHGKTAFIRAVTGIECDRLDEEKRRGITIVLGYAHLTLPSGIKVGIVDVPGHERFVNRMVAGAAGIDCVALVIAADEGIKPQTLEHLYICEILKIKKGIVVLNKKDLADDELLYLQTEEIMNCLSGTFLADAPIVPVSSLTGEGLPAFIEALDRIARDIMQKPLENPFRLPVDQVVSITGFGTVARGTVLSGHIRHDEEVAVLPSGRLSRIRGLQNHGVDVQQGRAGERLAINLADVKTEDIERGMVIARPDTFQATERILVELHYLPYNKKPLNPLSHGQFHVLAAKVSGRIQLIPEQKLPPGEKSLAVVTTVKPVVAAWGDAFVIRGYGTFTTIGGGRILHPHLQETAAGDISEFSVRSLRSENLMQRILFFIEERDTDGLIRSKLCGMLNESEQKTHEVIESLKKQNLLCEDDEQRLYHSDALQALKKRLGLTIAEFHRQHPLRAGMGKEELLQKSSSRSGLFHLTLERMLREDLLNISGDLISAKHFSVTERAEASLLFDRIETLFRRYGLKPESLSEALRTLDLDQRTFRAGLDYLARSGRLVRIKENYYLHQDVLDQVRAGLRMFFQTRTHLTPPDLRDLFGLSRKHMIPLLEYLDSIKFTLRSAEGRRLFGADRSASQGGADG